MQNINDSCNNSTYIPITYANNNINKKKNKSSKKNTDKIKLLIDII